MQERLKLNSFQRKILIGTLLGDGCLISNAYGKNYRLQIEHMSKHKKYVDWKYKIFKNFCLSRPKFQQRTNSWKFRTISHPDFTKFREMFYWNGRKILPIEISKILTSPIILAVWFMDDGALGPGQGRKGLTFNTQNFSREENEKLRDLLKNKFLLKTSLHKDKTSWRIYIFPRSVPRFKKLVIKLIFKEFKYKFLTS